MAGLIRLELHSTVIHKVKEIFYCLSILMSIILKAQEYGILDISYMHKENLDELTGVRLLR